jgi:hypothetical protein
MLMERAPELFAWTQVKSGPFGDEMLFTVLKSYVVNVSHNLCIQFKCGNKYAFILIIFIYFRHNPQFFGPELQPNSHSGRFLCQKLH